MTIDRLRNIVDSKEWVKVVYGNHITGIGPLSNVDTVQSIVLHSHGDIDTLIDISSIYAIITDPVEAEDYGWLIQDKS